jgi:hypothetical protein
MRIIQISTVFTGLEVRHDRKNGGEIRQDAEIYGLGDDGKLYRWGAKRVPLDGPFVNRELTGWVEMVNEISI